MPKEQLIAPKLKESMLQARLAQLNGDLKIIKEQRLGLSVLFLLNILNMPLPRSMRVIQGTTAFMEEAMQPLSLEKSSKKSMPMLPLRKLRNLLISNQISPRVLINLIL